MIDTSVMADACDISYIIMLKYRWFKNIEIVAHRNIICTLKNEKRKHENAKTTKTHTYNTIFILSYHLH